MQCLDLEPEWTISPKDFDEHSAMGVKEPSAKLREKNTDQANPPNQCDDASTPEEMLNDRRFGTPPATQSLAG